MFLADVTASDAPLTRRPRRRYTGGAPRRLHSAYMDVSADTFADVSAGMSHFGLSLFGGRCSCAILVVFDRGPLLSCLIGPSEAWRVHWADHRLGRLPTYHSVAA